MRSSTWRMELNMLSLGCFPISVARHEAVELRDGDKTKYLGKGVLKAIANINDKIGPALVGLDPTDQSKVDKTMVDLDKTENKVPTFMLWSFDIMNVPSLSITRSVHRVWTTCFKHTSCSFSDEEDVYWLDFAMDVRFCRVPWVPMPFSLYPWQLVKRGLRRRTWVHQFFLTAFCCFLFFPFCSHCSWLMTELYVPSHGLEIVCLRA